MKRVHAPGKCNHEMTGKLKKHSADADDADNGNDEQQVDPRWAGLKDIQFEEDN